MIDFFDSLNQTLKVSIRALTQIWGEKCCLCNFIYKWLDFLRTINRRSRLTIPWMLIILWDVKEPTHYSYKSRVIPVLWLSFVCERGVGEVEHLVRDFEVLLCPFPLGNKSCPVKWTKSLNQIIFTMRDDCFVVRYALCYSCSLPSSITGLRSS